jgi:hypothetical protein
MIVRRERRRGAHGAERDGWNSIQAGLVAVALVGVTMATFGPAFRLAVGYGLLSGAFVAAVFAMVWADRVGHSQTPVRRARRDARSGQFLSGIALVLILYYTGTWILLVFAWPLALAVGLVAWSLHRDRIVRKVGPQEVRT